MSYASDKLYNGYLRRKMPAIVSKVKVREIIVHLPCLTAHDRETIEAKRETNGNFDSMVLLLDCLRRRESWPQHFIQALQECEHLSIAAEVQAEYDALRGVDDSSPSSAPTTVITAHVHPAPSVAHLPVPGSAAAPAAPREPAAPPAPPLEASAPEVVSPPQLQPQPPRVAQMEVASLPSTPPPSPETPSHATTESPPAEDEVRQEPEENSESDIQVISGDSGVVPDQVTEQSDSQSGPELPTATQEAASPPAERKVPQEPEENSESDLLGISAAIPDHVTPEKSEVLDEPSSGETDSQLNPDPVQTVETTEVVSAAPEEEEEKEEEEEEKEEKEEEEEEVGPEEDVQETPGDTHVIPDIANAAQIKVVVDLVMTPPMSPCEKDTPSVPEPVHSAATTDSPPQSPTSPAQESLDSESSFPLLTPEKLPVQETGTTEATEETTEEATKEATEETTKAATEETTKAATEETTEEATEETTEEATEETTEETTKEATEETTEEAMEESIEESTEARTEETAEAPTTQVVEMAPSALLDANGLDGLVSEDDSLFLSKPQVLLSAEPANHHSPTLAACDPPSEPYSGDSGRLEMSGHVGAAQVPACAAVAAVLAEPPCQQNGIALHHDEEPEENHCESSCPSLEGQEVRVNVVHVSEEPSILNLQAQASAPPQIVNGEAAREMAAPSPPPPPPPTADAAEDEDDPPSDHTCLHPEATVELKTLPNTEEKPAPGSNRKYYLTAAGVGACALLMAWKFKH